MLYDLHGDDADVDQSRLQRGVLGRVGVRGPLTDLLLVIYKRRPARSKGIEILGDAQLLDFWLERVSFE